MIYNCLKCDEEIPEELVYHFQDDIQCPHCQHIMTSEYEESYDPDTGDEWGWFTLIEK